MADNIQAYKKQSKAEIRQWDFSFVNDLVTGVTVSTATAMHVPPSGTATTPSVSVTSPVVSVTLGPVTVIGLHVLDVVATLSNGEKSEAHLNIQVDF